MSAAHESKGAWAGPAVHTLPERRHRPRPVLAPAHAPMGAPAAHDASVLHDGRRLAAVRTAASLDHGVRRVTDSLVALAGRALAAPIAVVTLVDTDRQILMSASGRLGWWARVGETPIEYSFCRHVVMTGARLVIPETHTSRLAAGNPFVMELGVRAYAGSPIRTRDGRCIGAFAVMSLTPRAWSAADLEMLDELAIAAGLEIANAAGSRDEPRESGEEAGPAGEPRPADGQATVVPGTHAALRLWAELQKRRVVRVSAVYLAIAWLIIDVSSEVLPPLGVPDYAQTIVVLLAALAFPLVAGTAWAFDLTARGIIRTDDRGDERGDASSPEPARRARRLPVSAAVRRSSARRRRSPRG